MKEPSSPNSKYARFSSLVIQMGVIIGLFSWLGTYLDKTNDSGRLWTVILSLSGVAIALYLIIREVIKIGKEDE
jgi:F0F1-type ATP synthase assembly protein I